MNFKKIILFIILFFVFDRSIGFLITIYSKKNITDRRIEKIIKGKISSDLIILGSSRAARNINASTIEKYSGISSYNLGRPGSNIDYHDFLLKFLIEFSETPKYLMLIIDPGFIKVVPSLTFRYDLIYQFSNYEYIKNLLIERGQLNSFLTKISLSYTMKHAFLETFKPHKMILGRNPLYETASDGSMNLPSNNNSNINYSVKMSTYDSKNESGNLKNKFLDILNICRNKKIKLILAMTPGYYKPMMGLNEKLKELVGKDAVILDYRDIEEFKNPAYFNDGLHLNVSGAKKLSKKIGLDLKVL